MSYNNRMVNRLTREKQTAVASALVEGCSIRSTERIAGVDRQTGGTLLERVGCADLLNECMVDLPCKRLEIDELRAFVGKTQRHVKKTDDASRVGDQWTYLAIDADTKLILAFFVGKRARESTRKFITDLALRLANRVASTALFVVLHHSFVCRHHTLRVTPATEVGLDQTMWSVGDLLDATIGSVS